MQDVTNGIDAWLPHPTSFCAGSQKQVACFSTQLNAFSVRSRQRQRGSRRERKPAWIRADPSAHLSLHVHVGIAQQGIVSRPQPRPARRRGGRWRSRTITPRRCDARRRGGERGQRVHCAESETEQEPWLTHSSRAALASSLAKSSLGVWGRSGGEEKERGFIWMGPSPSPHGCEGFSIRFPGVVVVVVVVVPAPSHALGQDAPAQDASSSRGGNRSHCVASHAGRQGDRRPWTTNFGQDSPGQRRDRGLLRPGPSRNWASASEGMNSRSADSSAVPCCAASDVSLALVRGPSGLENATSSDATVHTRQYSHDS
jgi:hypothetical protein